MCFDYQETDLFLYSKRGGGGAGGQEGKETFKHQERASGTKGCCSVPVCGNPTAGRPSHKDKLFLRFFSGVTGFAAVTPVSAGGPLLLFLLLLGLLAPASP